VSRCAACHTLLRPGDEREECPACRQEYHASCWRELGGCASYGCEKAARAEKPPPPAVVGAGWGDTKVGPKCRKEIASSLLICRCGARFPGADPMEPEEYARWVRQQALQGGTRRTILALFFVSLSGFLAPFAGLGAGVIAFRHRRLLAGADGTYLAMGYGAAALGALYTVVMVLLLTGA
jgi:hypothetical protein